MLLSLLEPHAHRLITEEFLAAGSVLQLEAHLKDFGRKVDLEPLVNTVRTAMEKYQGMQVGRSDRWLASRVHAALRLNRREAADPRLWEFLAVSVLPDYVRWRWPSTDIRKRFIAAPEYIQAIARLWWGAELTRNGSSYALTPLLYENQDLQNSWARCDLFDHRPTALASLRVLSTLQDGKFASSDQIRDLVKSFNMALTTTLLDAVAPDRGVDAEAFRMWCREDVDETLWLESDPEGPPEDEVSEESIEAVTSLLHRVIAKTKFARRLRSGAALEAAEGTSVPV